MKTKNSPMNIVIIDDEKAIRDGLKEMVELYCEDVKVVGSGGSVSEAVILTKQLKPDALLLDIRIEGGSGFDVISQLGEVTPMIIFITAYEEYAIKAFKYNAVDYLVKPVDPEELEDALSRATQRLSKNDNRQLMQSLQEALGNKQKPEKLVLRTQNNIHAVRINDIIYCMSDGAYTHVVLADQKIVVSKLIKEYTELLRDHGFIRIHQSYLINLNKMVKYNKEGYVHLESDVSLPVAARRKEQFLMEVERFFQ